MMTYVLRTCRPDGSSYNGFRWPVDVGGVATAPDWDPDPRIDCGRGLHGLLMGEGHGALLDWSADARWLVVEVDDAVLVPSAGGGKVRFKSGRVVYSGDRKGATDWLIECGANPAVVVGGTATAGYRGTATAGYGGTATAGDGGTATAGDGGTATAGDRGCLVARWWDYAHDRWRIATAYVGEDGIEAGVAYRLDEKGKWVRAEAKS